jgi:hypothetical protein
VTAFAYSVFVTEMPLDVTMIVTTTLTNLLQLVDPNIYRNHPKTRSRH